MPWLTQCNFFAFFIKEYAVVLVVLDPNSGCLLFVKLYSEKFQMPVFSEKERSKNSTLLEKV